jgi:ribosomal protein L24
MTRKNIITAVAFAFLVVAVIAGYKTYINQYQYLVLSSNQPFEFSLYKRSSGADSLEYSKNDVAFRSDKSGKYKIKKGDYVYVARSPDKDYLPIVNGLSLDKSKALVSINDFKYTEQKLQSLLSTESPEIESLVNSSYPIPMSSYTIQSSRLYYTGQWYGALLVPKDALNQDTYRIVLKKKDGRWSVVTTPPSIILSQPVYPNIPFDVLSDLNNKGDD